MITCFLYLMPVIELDLGSDRRVTVAGKTQRRGQGHYGFFTDST
jgi:hypothetical protein